MTRSKPYSSRFITAVQALAIYAWLTVLSPLSATDQYYSVYLLCGGAGFLCLWANHCRRVRGRTGLGFLAGLFSLAVAAANYPLFVPLSVLQNLFDLSCVLLGGFVVGWQILLTMYTRLPLAPAPGLRKHPGMVFWTSFFVIAAIDLAFLFFARYPGVLTADSFATMRQILGTVGYDNVMPFWHTAAVQVFVDLGLLLWGDLNAAVALFHVVQILFMAGCLSCVITTMYQMGVSRLVIAAVFAVYAFFPHNIVYSVTLWKDIPFAGAAVLLITALYRILRDIGRHTWLNYAAFLIGALGFCLWRTNGWYAFALVTVLMLLLGRGRRKLAVMMVGIAIVCWLLIGPVLDAWGVRGTDFTEAFAIPMQQAARVIHLERPLVPEDTQLLSRIFYLDRVKELYDPNNVDPIKFDTFRREEIPFLLEHWQDYLGLYLRLGLAYPGDFFQAWVEQTKGYWNGGYFYYTYTLVFGTNTLGLFQTPGDNLIARGFAALFRYLEKPEILQCFVSIGLHTWALAACAGITALRKRQEFLLTVPCLVLILGLWLGTPVYAEFRYAYPMILSMPMILAAAVYGADPSDRP